MLSNNLLIQKQICAKFDDNTVDVLAKLKTIEFFSLTSKYIYNTDKCMEGLILAEKPKYIWLPEFKWKICVISLFDDLDEI